MTTNLTPKIVSSLGIAALNLVILATNALATPSSPEVTPRYVVIDLGTDIIYPRKVTNSGFVLGDNHKSSFYVWFNGVIRELKPKKSGDVLTVENISETGIVEGSETSPTQPGAKSSPAYFATWSKNAIQPDLTLVPVSPVAKIGQSVQDQLRGMILPQDANSPVTPQCSNAAVTLLPEQPGAVSLPAQLMAATQVIGNGSGSSYIWEMKPTRSNANTFEGPHPINYLLPGGPTNSPWNVTFVSSINDGGTIAGTALYKPTGAHDPIAAGLHGVLLMPLAIVRETTPGSGDYEPIIDNGLDDNAMLPIYRTESGIGRAETDKSNTISAVLFQNLSSTSVATMVVQLENKSGETDEAKLTETAAGSGIFHDESNHVTVTLSPLGQTTSDTIVDRLSLLVDNSKLGFKDEAFTLQESSAVSNSFTKVGNAVAVILSKPLSESAINTILIALSDDMGASEPTLIETALNSKVFSDSTGTTVTVTHYKNGVRGSMNVAITGKAFSVTPFLATLSETSRTSLQYSNYERIIGDEPVSTPATDGQGIFYIQMPGTTAANITLVSGDHHLTVWATPVKGQANLLRTGKLVLIEPGDPFRAKDITTIQAGRTLQLDLFGRKVVD